MANTASNVVVGKPKTSGGVYAGATSATLPTTPTAALNVSLSALGYITEDGVTVSTSFDTNVLRAWGTDPIRVISSNDEVTASWSFLETTLAVFKEYFGQSNASTTVNDTTVTVNATQMGERAFVFEVLDGTTAFRIVLPKAVVTSKSDLTFNDTDAVSFGVTVTALPDASGNKAYIYHTLYAS